MGEDRDPGHSRFVRYGRSERLQAAPKVTRERAAPEEPHPRPA